MGEKGNVAAAATGGSGLVEGALDTSRVVVEKATDVVVEGATGAATGIVSDRVRERMTSEETEEPKPGDEPGDDLSA